MANNSIIIRILPLVAFLLLGNSLDNEYPAKVIDFIHRTHRYTNNTFQFGTTLYSKFFSPLEGSVKTHKQYANDTLLFHTEYNKYGDVTLYKKYEQGELSESHIIKYEGDKIRSERGLWNIDYVHVDSENFVAISREVDPDNFYVSADTAYYRMNDKVWSVERNYRGGLFDSDKYVHEFDADGRLLTSKSFHNKIHVRENVFKYDSAGRLTEASFIDFSNFSSEKRIFEAFKNKVYTYLYDKHGLVDTMKVERYEPAERKWLNIGFYNYQYSYEEKEDGKVVRVETFYNGERWKTNIYKLDENYNWIQNTYVSSDNDTSVINRVLEYY